MKSLLLTLSLALLNAGCASHLTRHTDDSSSNLPQDEAVAIARRAVSETENWPDEPRIKNRSPRMVLYAPVRTNRGGWRVIARPALSENKPDAGGGAAFEPSPAAVIRISEAGEVTDYSHISYEASCREFARH